MTEKQTDFLDSHLAAERAIDELRRQMGIVIREDSGHAAANYPAEFLDKNMFPKLRSPSLRLLVTAARAQTLGLAEQAVKIDVHGLSLADIMALSDPLAAKKSLPALNHAPASDVDSMALTLAKYASLLPALAVMEPSESTSAWLEVSAGDLRHAIDHPLVDIIETAHAALPVEGAENSRIVSFRSRYSTSVHLALVIGVPDADAPLVRVHSSCVTGDILGSLRCDCGDQLKLALEEIIKAGGGILVYLHQEGRGIGITNKLRAYRLQEQGFDTYDANLMLGFEEDERDFSIAAAILKKLNVTAIRMLTNNPHKMAAIEKTGIRVSERVPLVVQSGRHNHGYLQTKAKKSGHLL